MPRGRPPKDPVIDKIEKESGMGNMSEELAVSDSSESTVAKKVPSPEIMLKKSKNIVGKLVKPNSFAALTNAYKEKQKNLFIDQNKKIEVIPTGSWIFDYVTGTGGWVKGRVSEIYGAESCGKTTVAIATGLEASLLGIPTLFVDAEQAFLPDYAKKLGWDFDSGLFAVFQPESLEETVDVTFDFLDKLGELLIVIDSIPALTPNKTLYNREVWDKTMGSKAKLQGEFLDSLQKKINRQNATVLALNQVRANMNAGFFGETTQASGGFALKHYLSTRFLMKVIKREATKENDAFAGDPTNTITSLQVQIKNKKNKIQNPYRSGIMYLKPGDGIDNLKNLLEAGVNRKVIHKGGAGYYSVPSYSDEKVHGMPALYSWFESDTDLMLHTMKQLNWIKGDSKDISSADLDLSGVTSTEVPEDPESYGND